MTHPTPTNLQVGLSPYALVHDAQRISFSWTLPTNGYQTAYHLTVSLGDSARPIFDSHWVSSHQNTAVIPAGLTDQLQSDRLYTWQVAVRYTNPVKGESHESPFSSPACFVTAPVFSNAVGLWAGDDLYAFLRKEFHLPVTLKERMSRAILTVTAASPEPARQYVYHAYINGQSVGLGPARLDKTLDGQDVLYYQSFDITDLLQSGNNCLGAICYTAADKSFFCRVTVYDGEGQPAVLCDTQASETWQALQGDPIYRPNHSIGTHYFRAHACNIDGNSFPHGFSLVGYQASEWQDASVKEDMTLRYRLLPSPTANVHEYPAPTETVKVTVTDTGSYLVDLGREIVGGFALALPVESSTEITLSYGEELTPEGHVKAPMRTGNHYREQWLVVPHAEPLFTLSLMTYRYIEIQGSPTPVTPDMAWGLERRADFDDTLARLTCEHPFLSRLWALMKHTVKVTTQDLYVDSQSRERTAYEGDLLINLMAAYACGGDLSVGRFTIEYLCTHRTWPAEYPLFVIICAWTDYMATGDISFLRDYSSVLEAMVFTEYLDRQVGLITSPGIQSSQTDSVLVDWPMSERDGYDMEAPFNTVFNALCVSAYGALANIFSVLSERDKAKTYANLTKSIKKAMISRLYDTEDGSFFDGCDAHTRSPHKSQHATAFCLACGIYSSEEMKNAMAATLASHGCIRMSVYGAYFLLNGLYKSGHGDIANRLMLSPDTSEGARTWAYMLDTLGATVTTEAWNRTNKPNMTYSHPWGAAPAHMIATGIFGITPTAPAYQSFDIRPCLPEGITQASFTLPTVSGKITVTFDGSIPAYRITVPFNTEASLYLPDGKGEREIFLTPGEHTVALS